MELPESLLCPRADIALPALLGAEQRQPDQIAHTNALAPSKAIIFPHHQPKVIHLRKEEMLVLPPIRKPTQNGKVQKPLVQPRYVASPDINTEDFQAAVDFLSVQDRVDPERIGICGICKWGSMALNAAALDTRVKATVASTMYDMTRVNANGYFDSEDSEEARHQKKVALNAQRTTDYRAKSYALGGGVVDPLPDDAPFFVRGYYDYYKTRRGYHARSLNSNGGWNVTGCMSFINQPILKYSNEIRSAVLVVVGEKARSRYFSEDAFANMTRGSDHTQKFVQKSFFSPKNKNLFHLYSVQIGRAHV